MTKNFITPYKILLSLSKSKGQERTMTREREREHTRVIGVGVGGTGPKLVKSPGDFADRSYQLARRRGRRKTHGLN